MVATEIVWPRKPGIFINTIWHFTEKKIIDNPWPGGSRKALRMTCVLNQILKNKIELVLVECWLGE